MSKISELSDGGSLVSSDYLIAVRSGGNVKVRMDQINVDQVDLGDNEFIRLGNSQDLTMVHTSTQSIINQAGIGDLLLQKAGATKLTINATGIDVSGSVTADGLTVEGSDNSIVSRFKATNGIFRILPFETGLGVKVTALNGDESAFETLALQAEDFHFVTGTTERMRIDASGRVGIGVVPSTIWSSSYDALQIGLGGSVYAHGGAGSNVHMAANSVYEGTAPNYYDKYLTSSTASKYAQDSGLHIWSTAASGTAGNAITWSEAMRIDASGSLLVGTTDDSIWNNTTGNGINLRGDLGLIASARTNAEPLMINRMGTDGEIIKLNKDGALVGSIATWDGDLAVGQENVALKFNDGQNEILPWSVASNLNRDNGFNLGSSSSRFKDLYLSGSANINGNINNYVPTNSGNPEFSIGSSATNRLFVQSVYNSGAQVLNYTVFRTFTSSSTAHAGRIVFSVDEADKLEINDGGIAVTGGIAFSDAGGSGTSSSNTLDSYEEGTWTPAASSDASPAAYNFSIGYYTKIGRKVHVTGQFQISSMGSFAGAIVNISGLPFNIANITTYDPRGIVGIKNAATAKSEIFLRGVANTDYMRLEANNGNTSSDRNCNANVFDTDTICYVDLTYFVA